MSMVTIDTDEQPANVVRLLFCEVRRYDGWVWTDFPDGSGYGAYPPRPDVEGAEEVARYLALAQSLGYENSMDYCWEHEVFHGALAEWLHARPSPVLWALAHGKTHPEYTVEEEAIVQLFQGFVRGGRPLAAVAPDVDWWSLRRAALNLLDGSAVLPREAVA